MKHLLAIIAIIISVTAFSQSADEYLKSGLVKHNSQDFEGAIKDYSNAIKADKNLRDGYYNRAVCELALQDFNAAKKRLRQNNRA